MGIMGYLWEVPENSKSLMRQNPIRIRTMFCLILKLHIEQHQPNWENWRSGNQKLWNGLFVLVYLLGIEGFSFFSRWRKMVAGDYVLTSGSWTVSLFEPIIPYLESTMYLINFRTRSFPLDGFMAWSYSKNFISYSYRPLWLLMMLIVLANALTVYWIWWIVSFVST